MAGVRGETHRVGNDIIEYLTEVAKYFDLNIIITSGFRNADDQALAMFNYWKRLQRGRVYSRKTLPEEDRQRLDGHFEIFEDKKSSTADRAKAKSDFLKLAKEKGAKSKHGKGRAVDIAQSCLTLGAYRAIAMQMRAVREDNRKDIYHFESDYPIPRVTKADKLLWGLNTIRSETITGALALGGGIGCMDCGS